MFPEEPVKVAPTGPVGSAGCTVLGRMYFFRGWKGGGDPNKKWSTLIFSSMDEVYCIVQEPTN